MNILFVHQNYAGQYKHILDWLGARGEHRTVFLTQREVIQQPSNHHIIQYLPDHAPNEEAYAYTLCSQKTGSH